MIAQGVHHISFSVADLERSQRFYGQLLGLAPIARPDLGIPGAWYRAGAAEVHLIERPASAPAAAPPGALTPLANHQAFAIADYEKVLAALKQQEIPVLETSAERGQMWVQDPDGNVIELIVPAQAQGT